MHVFNQIIALLKRHYGAPQPPPAKGPFEMVLWENACYLLPDERRLEVFDALRAKVGLTAAELNAASDDVLLPIAERGGMRPEVRVSRWREIARITLERHAGNLDSILKLPNSAAKRALREFPAIGDPGAEKILLLCGVACGLPLESNGLRVLVRLGWGREETEYESTYRSVQTDLKAELPASAVRLKEAHLLLRTHGKTLCKDHAPLCYQCPVAAGCDHALRTAGAVPRTTR